MPNIQLTIPDVAPVMVLPTVLFPHALMPLYIFEPRYRAMLQWALEHDRMFCIAMQRMDSVETGSPEDFVHTAGLGLIRASVEREDGTSHLMLQGLVRVQFTSFASTTPFYLAQIDPLPSTGVPESKSAENYQELITLAGEVRTLCQRIREKGSPTSEGIDEFFAKVEDPDVLSDSAAHAFLRAPMTRQDVLEEPNVRRRLIKLARYLRAELDLPI